MNCALADRKLNSLTDIQAGRQASRPSRLDGALKNFDPEWKPVVCVEVVARLASNEVYIEVLDSIGPG